MADTQVSMTINGKIETVTVPSMKRLLDVLREDLRLVGTKEGCGEGECGACSVILDGELVNSCLVPAKQADGARIETIEGLAHTSQLHSLSAGVRRGRRGAVRHLHAGHDYGGLCLARPPFASIALADSRGFGGQHLPLHRIPEDF